MTALRFRLFLLTIFSLIVIVPARADKRVALVIGNGAYEKADKLVNPPNDAAAIANMLTAAGFDKVDLRRNLGIRELRKAISDFANGVRDADTAVVYYSGHGIEVDGTNYLIPIDASLDSDIDAPYEAYSLDNLLKVLEPAKRLRLVVLDACRDNPYVRSMKRSVSTRSMGRGLVAVEPTSVNTLVGFAAKAGSYALDGDGLNSPYATALLNNLATPGLDLRIAFGRVRDEVLKATRRKQEPFVYGSLGGDEIYIVPPVPKPAPLPPPTADEIFWVIIKDSSAAALFDEFLNKFPASPHAAEARSRLEQLKKAEKDRLAKEQADRDRLAKEQAEKDRLAKEQADRDRLAKEQVEKDRLAKEQAEKDRLVREQAEKDRLAKEQVEKDRLAKEQAERDRLAKELAEKDRLAKEQADRDRLAKEQAERDRLAKEQAERDRLAKEQAERDRLAKEQAEKDRLAREQAEKDELAKEQTTAKPASAENIKTAELTPPVERLPGSSTAAALSGIELVEGIKKELKRVGCYSGAIDDNWSGAETKSSIAKFVKYAELSAAPDDPAIDFLNILRGKTGRVCPLECSAREIEKDGECVPKPHPMGSGGNGLRQGAQPSQHHEPSQTAAQPSGPSFGCGRGVGAWLKSQGKRC
jgi:hypothetical protein